MTSLKLSFGVVDAVVFGEKNSLIFDFEFEFIDIADDELCLLDDREGAGEGVDRLDGV